MNLEILLLLINIAVLCIVYILLITPIVKMSKSLDLILMVLFGKSSKKKEEKKKK